MNMITNYFNSARNWVNDFSELPVPIKTDAIMLAWSCAVTASLCFLNCAKKISEPNPDFDFFILFSVGSASTLSLINGIFKVNLEITLMRLRRGDSRSDAIAAAFANRPINRAAPAA